MEKSPNSEVRGIHTEGLISLYISETDKTKRVISLLLAQMCIAITAYRTELRQKGLGVFKT